MTDNQQQIKKQSSVMPQSAALISDETYSKGMLMLSNQFPNVILNEERVTMWGQMVSDMTDEQFIKGVKTFCLNHKEIFPNTNVIAYIREYGLIDKNRKNSAEAWGDVLLKVRHTGIYQTPTFTDELIKKAVDCVGWRDICLSENISVERAHFLKAYDALIEREKFNAVSNIGG